MKVHEVMTVGRGDDDAGDAAEGGRPRARNARRISGMPVVDEAGLVVGVLSEADILAKEGGEQERNGFLQWFLDPTDPWVAARFDASPWARRCRLPRRRSPRTAPSPRRRR